MIEDPGDMERRKQGVRNENARELDRRFKRVRDSVSFVVGICLLVLTGLGVVQDSAAPTMVLVAGSLCGLPMFLGAVKRNGN